MKRLLLFLTVLSLLVSWLFPPWHIYASVVHQWIFKGWCCLFLSPEWMARATVDIYRLALVDLSILGVAGLVWLLVRDAEEAP